MQMEEQSTAVEKKRLRGVWALSACILALLLSAFAAVCHAGEETSILRGVRVAGMDVGGMEQEEALSNQKEQLSEPFAQTQVLLCEQGALVTAVRCGEIGAALALEEAVEEVCSLGREGGSSLFASFARGWRRLFGRQEADILPRVEIDREILSAVLPVTPQNAWYDAESGQVMEGRIGILFDVAELEEALSLTKPGGTLEFEVQVAQQEISADHLRQVLFRDTLGTYTTTVGGSSVRKNNVALSAAAIDGCILLAGEIFDFNAVVGERTAERGYGAAPAYVNGETVESIGGGICQTSSTLYLAALLSNLEIIERYAHRYASSYIPLGMDATVSWGGPEFRFRNDTAYPLRIQAAMRGEELTVTILGTNIEDVHVEITNEVLSRRPYTTRYQETDSLAPGEQRLQQSGYTGYTVQTYRNVYDSSGELLYTNAEARSVYQSRDQILLIGPSAEAETPQEENPAEGSVPEEASPAGEAGVPLP